jgi:hypothetical protein
MWVALMVGGVALLVVAASTAGVYGYQRLQERPVQEAFNRAHRSFVVVVKGLEAADDVEQLAEVGTGSRVALRTLETQQRLVAGRDSELATSLAPMLAAEAAFLTASSGLGALTEEDLTGWGLAQDRMLTAHEAVRTAAKASAVDEQGAAGAGTATDAAMSHVATVVGTAVADSAQSSLRDLLRELAVTKNTGDIRRLASRAALEGATAEAGRSGLAADSAQAERLTSFEDVYAAVEGLAVLDGDHLKSWAAKRATMSMAVGALDGALRDVGQRAQSNVNDVIERGQQAIREWQTSYRAAVEDQRLDAAAMDAYRSKMDAQLSSYSSLRADLSDFIGRVDDPANYITYDQAFSELSEAQWDRQTVRDVMNGLEVPTEVQGVHQGVLSVIDVAIAAVQSAYDGASDAQNCMSSCYYKDTAGWQRFSRDSAGITTSFAGAVAAWESGVASAATSIEERALPHKPTV